MFHAHHTKRRPTLLLGALLAATALVMTTFIASAAQADELSWGISPGGDEPRSSFSYELEPGEVVRDSFDITNFGATEITLGSTLLMVQLLVLGLLN